MGFPGRFRHGGGRTRRIKTEATWIEIYRHTIEPLYRFVSRRAGGAVQLTEDVVQETYLRGIDRFGEARAPREPLAWLQTVARDFLISHYRRVAPAALDALLESGASGDAEAVRSVHAGLARLGDGKARLVEALYKNGMLSSTDLRRVLADRDRFEAAVELAEVELDLIAARLEEE